MDESNYSNILEEEKKMRSDITQAKLEYNSSNHSSSPLKDERFSKKNKVSLLKQKLTHSVEHKNSCAYSFIFGNAREHRKYLDFIGYTENE